MKVGGCFLCNKNQKLIMTYGEFMNNKIKGFNYSKVWPTNRFCSVRPT
jgi:hypothetical protein